MVPEGWKIQKIADCLERVVDPVAPEPDKLYREIGIRSHAKGIFHKELVTGKSLGNKRVFNIQTDCFVVNIVFAWEQAIAKTSDAELGMIASHRFPMFKPKGNRCDINYITYFFKTSRGKYLLKLASPGGAGRNKTLGQGEFAKLELPLPPTKEQKKIAKILSTWDKGIATTEELLANSQQQKKSLMQQLLTGNLRLPGFSGEWEKKSVERIVLLGKEKFDSKKASIGQSCIELEHIEQRTGRLLNSITTDNAMSTKSVFQAGDVLFGKLRPYLRKYWLADHEGVCSTEIWVLKPKKEKIISSFLFQLVQTEHFIDATNISSGTHMPRADWNVVRDVLFRLPELIEQQKIAAVLSTADQEIETLQQKLECLKQEKKALMQQLLTGKRRVKIEKEEAA